MPAKSEPATAGKLRPPKADKLRSAAALVLSRIQRLVYGADDPKAGAVRSLYIICSDERLNHQIEVISGLRADECGRMLSDFFRARRAMGR